MEQKIRILGKTVILTIAYMTSLYLVSRLCSSLLFKYSIEFIINEQASISNLSFTFWTTFTKFGEFEVIYFFVSLCLVAVGLHACIFLILLLSLVATATSVIKMITQEPRPFIASYRIFSWQGCRPTFGDPSGHASLTSAFFFGILLYTVFLRPRARTLNTAKGRILVAISYACLFGFIVLMGLSRAYLGAHTFNQCITGSVLGVSFVHIYVWLIWPQIRRHLESMEISHEMGDPSRHRWFIGLGVASILGVITI